MNRTFRTFAAAVAGLALSLSAAAQAPQPPEIAARGYLLIDMTANQVLAERNADASAEPASSTSGLALPNRRPA